MTRLRFALSAFRASRGTVWKLLCLEAVTGQSPWMDLLASSLRWFGEILPAWVPEEVDLQCITVEQIEQWFESRLCPTKAAIRRCLRKHLLQEQLIGEVRNNYIRITDLFASHGRVAATQDAPHPKGGRFACNECPAVFQRAQQLQAHRWAKHSQISLERQYADGATCRACGCHFWTAQRVQQHLRQSRGKSDGCLERLFRYVLPHSEPQPAALPAHLQHVRRLPTIQIAPPLALEGPTLHDERQQEAWSAWCEQWEQLELPQDPPQELFLHCVKEFNTCTKDWARLDAQHRESIFDTWVMAMKRIAETQGCSDHMVEWMYILWYQRLLPDILGEWEDPDTIRSVEDMAYELLRLFPVFDVWQRRDSIVQPPPQLPAMLGEGEAPSRHSRTEDVWSAFNHQNDFLEEVIRPTLHQPMQPAQMGCIRGINGEQIIVIVHMFSGRRRDGDVHDWIARIAPVVLPDWHVWVLSMDTAVDAVKGNLTGPNFETLLRITALGLVAGGISGPPCETFSAARHLPPPDGCAARWPRPLRSELRLWGVSGLSLRELRQLKVGSQLYFHSNLVEFAVALNGGVTLEEHPASSGIAGQASSWQSAIHRHFAAHVEDSRSIRVDQWRFGASSVKPTVSRVMGAPSARFEVWKHWTRMRKGRHREPSWRASTAKPGNFAQPVPRNTPHSLARLLHKWSWRRSIRRSNVATTNFGSNNCSPPKSDGSMKCMCTVHRFVRMPSDFRIFKVSLWNFRIKEFDCYGTRSSQQPWKWKNPI